MSAVKDAKIAEAYQLIAKYPDQKTVILDRLLNAKTFKATIEDFNQYEALLTKQFIVEPDSIVDEYPEVTGFTQSDKYSDVKILEIFEERDSLQNMLDEIGAPPTDAEWFQAGIDADKRIAELRPFYETKKTEEWEALTRGTQPLAATIGAPLTALTQLFGGAGDLRYDFKEDFHERGMFSSWNPLTLFGALDIAEFRENPITDSMGFSPELIAMENELEKLYGTKRLYNEKIREGNYGETLPESASMTRLRELNKEISEEQLLDPRMFGEVK
tara:strand:+ start:1474 stop:2292 length:819 start_codon:yes stop_codon:yes gene_type:complete